MTSSRSSSDPDPVSITASPAVAWGTNTHSSPSPPARAAKAAARSVRSSTCLPAVSIRSSVVSIAASLVVFALTTGPVLVATSLAVSGLAIVLWNVVTVSLRQRITPDRLLGRMNAAYRLVGWGTMPIGALLGGVLAEALGLRPTFLVAAGITLATLVGFRWVTAEAVARAEAAEAPTG